MKTTRSLEDTTFWTNVEQSEDGCWLWTSVTHKGYGKFSFHGRTQLAHRLAYQHLVGDIPDGLHLDHLCRVRNCVNPDHLDPVTPAVNMRRKPGVGDFCGFTVHPRTPENTRVLSSGVEQCRVCTRAWDATKVPCDECGQLFQRKSMSRHVRRVHRGVPDEERPCPKCGDLISKSNLSRHAWLMHDAPPKPDMCKNGHLRTAENTYVSPTSGVRKCMECVRIQKSRIRRFR